MLEMSAPMYEETTPVEEVLEIMMDRLSNSKKNKLSNNDILLLLRRILQLTSAVVDIKKIEILLATVYTQREKYEEELEDMRERQESVKELIRDIEQGASKRKKK